MLKLPRNKMLMMITMMSHDDQHWYRHFLFAIWRGIREGWFLVHYLVFITSKRTEEFIHLDWPHNRKLLKCPKWPNSTLVIVEHFNKHTSPPLLPPDDATFSSPKGGAEVSQTLFKWEERDCKVCLITRQSHELILEIVLHFPKVDLILFWGIFVLRDFQSLCPCSYPTRNRPTLTKWQSC